MHNRTPRPRKPTECPPPGGGPRSVLLLLVGVLAALLCGKGSMSALAAPTNEFPPSVDGTPITLRNAVLRALKLRPLRKIDRDRLKQFKASESQARSGLFPQVSASYQNSYSNSLFGFFLFPGYQFFDTQLTTVTVNQLIFDFGRTFSQLGQAKWATRAQKETYQQTSQGIIRDVESAYYALLQAIEQESVTHLNVIDARNHLDAAVLRLRAGMGLKADVTQAKVNLSNAVLERIQAVNQRKKDQIILATTMGDSEEVHYVPLLDFPLPDGSLLRLQRDLERARRRNPGLLAARHQVMSSKDRLKAAWRQNYPTINGQAQYFLAQIPSQALGIPGIPNFPYSSFAFSGLVNIPIFEGGSTMSQVHQARAALNASMHQEEETKLTVLSQVRQAFLDIREARQALAETRTELENAEEYDRLEEGSYQAGKATALDVIDAQTALRKARADLVSAKYALALRVVLYHYAIGDLTPPESPDS